MKSINHRSIKLPLSLEKKISQEIRKLLNNPSEYNHYLVNGSVKVIPLISPNGKKYRLSGFSNGPSFKKCSLIESCPYINLFLDSIPGKKFSCRISIMEGKTEIFPHRDYFRSLEFGVVRLHVPIQTDPKIFFNIEGKNYHLQRGHLHYVDISKVHYLKNPLKKKRIHFIIDLEVTAELLDLFKINKVQKKLSYLNLPVLKKWFSLREMSFSMPTDKIPYPLSLSIEKWTIKKIGKEWYLTSKGYKYLISTMNTGHYYLDSIGPGFYFCIQENSIKFCCSGITTIGADGIVNEQRSFTVKVSRPFQAAPLCFKRSFNFIQVKHFSDDLVLVKKDDPDLIYFLSGLSKELWTKNVFVVESQQEHKEALNLSRLGLLERTHSSHILSN